MSSAPVHCPFYLGGPARGLALRNLFRKLPFYYLQFFFTLQRLLFHDPTPCNNYAEWTWDGRTASLRHVSVHCLGPNPTCQATCMAQARGLLSGYTNRGVRLP